MQYQLSPVAHCASIARCLLRFYDAGHLNSLQTRRRLHKIWYVRRVHAIVRRSLRHRMLGHEIACMGRDRELVRVLVRVLLGRHMLGRHMLGWHRVLRRRHGGWHRRCSFFAETPAMPYL